MAFVSHRLWSTSLRGAKVWNGRACFASGVKVNDVYRPGRKTPRCPTPADKCVRSPCLCSGDASADAVKQSILEKHADRKWSTEEVRKASDDHMIFTWGAGDLMSGSCITACQGDGVHFIDTEGKRYLDFNSMAMCSQLGHTVPKEISDAVIKQMSEIPYMYPGMSISPIRAKLCTLLADMVPGDINNFLFPSGGAESNEVALRIARVYTGRHKVISRYRSYHGATTSTLTLTGDMRRWSAEAGATGIVHAWDPYPYSFALGDTEEEIAQRALDMLDEQFAYEGPHTIAAFFLESIVGANGILKPPRGYLEGVRELCTKHGILMVCDEVMAGFGRTGKLFGFCHAPSVVPDIVTFAKGLNAAFLPLGGVGVRDPIAAHFRTHPICTGSTYNGHPIPLASAYATLKYYLKNNIIEHVADMEQHLVNGMQFLLDRHPSVKQARAVGLFGCLDIAGSSDGTFHADFAQPLTPAMAAFKRKTLEDGLSTMMRGHTVFCNPPLISTKEDIEEGIAILDGALHILDEAMDK